MIRILAPLLMTLVFMAKVVHAASPPKVVTTIKPIYALVLAVTQDPENTTLLVDNLQSPHGFQLRPSHLKALSNADLVVYIDKNFETFLKRPLNNITVTRKVVLGNIEGLNILPTRRGDSWHNQRHSNGSNDHHNHSSNDLHIWLDPNNAITMTYYIANLLGEHYPEKQRFYKKNANNFVKLIHAKDMEIKNHLANVKDTPFTVFHDSIQYFEQHYGLRALGTVIKDPSHIAAAKHVRNARKRIIDNKAQCILDEVQFGNTLADTAFSDLGLKFITIDPIGSTIPLDANFYPTLLGNLADSLHVCLSAD